MRWKTTLVLLLVTVGIGAYVSLYELKQPTPEEREQLAKQVVQVDPSSVFQLVLDLPQAKVTLTRDDAAWKLAPKNVRANTELIEQILYQLSPLRAERVLSAKPNAPLDLKTFGLDPAIGWLSIIAGGSPVTLLIGEVTALPSHRYLKLSNRPEVFIVSSSLFDLANVAPDTFRDPLLVHAQSALTKQLTITSAHGTQAGATALVDALGAIQIKRFVNDVPTVEGLAEWGFDHPKAEVVIQSLESTTPMTIFFGNTLKDDASLLYAKRDDDLSVYAVAASEVDSLLKDPAILRAKPPAPPTTKPTTPSPQPH